jgi:hypothetical protein
MLVGTWVRKGIRRAYGMDPDHRFRFYACQLEYAKGVAKGKKGDED